MKNVLIGIGAGLILQHLINPKVGKLEDYKNPPRGRVDQYWKKKLSPGNYTGRTVLFKNYQVQEVVTKFGLFGIEFGNWMNQNDRQTFLNNLVIAFEDLSKLLNIPQSLIGGRGKLSVAFGARGKSRALAHYESTYFVINLTKTKGMFGVLAHEYGHFVDHLVGYKLHRNGLATRNLNSNHQIINEYINLFDALYYNPDGNPTEYNLAQKKRSRYYKSLPEVFARSIEVFMYSKLKNHRIVNDFLQETPDTTTPPIKLVLRAKTSIAKILNFALK